VLPKVLPKGMKLPVGLNAPSSRLSTSNIDKISAKKQTFAISFQLYNNITKGTNELLVKNAPLVSNLLSRWSGNLAKLFTDSNILKFSSPTKEEVFRTAIPDMINQISMVLLEKETNQFQTVF
jgi:hypothetical protein